MRDSRPDPQTILEDALAFVGGVAARLLQGVEEPAGKDARAREKKDVLRDLVLQKLDLVTRAEFEVAFAMLSKIRAQQEDFEVRLARLEALAEKTPNQSSSVKAKKAPKRGDKASKAGAARQKKTKSNPQKKSKNLPSLNQKQRGGSRKSPSARIKRLK